MKKLPTWIFTFVVLPIVFGLMLARMGYTIDSWEYWVMMFLFLTYGLGQAYLAKKP